MSMQPRPWPQVPEATARAAAAKGPYPLTMRIRDELGELFGDAEFAQAFATRGRPGWSPGQLALVTVLQYVENLTDRAAAHRVRFGMDVKYALGLELDDPGFDASVLSEFRTRLVAHGLEERALDLLRAALKDKELVSSGGRQRTDSPYVLAAVRDLNRTELAAETLRAALEALAVAAPEWLAGAVPIRQWTQRYGPRISSWQLPTSKAERAELVLAYGQDGVALLKAVYAPDAPVWLRQVHAVQVLRQVGLQHDIRTATDTGQEVIKQREAETDGLPPSRLRLTSPYDLDARCGLKQNLWWVGYKVHVSETCDAPEAGQAFDAGGAQGVAASAPQIPAQRPCLITNVATTDATVIDAEMTEPIHRRLAGRDLLPAEHYLDSGYPSAELLITSLQDFGVALITPVLGNSSPQARAGAGFERTAFTIDWEARQAICPRGQRSTWWSPGFQRGTQTIVVKFHQTTCQDCPVRGQCTRAPTCGRTLTLRPREIQQALDTARAHQASPAWRTRYAIRAGVEGTIHQAVAVTGMRQARYRGLKKVHLEHVYSAVALNLIRLDAWWNGHPLDRSRTSHLARLDLTLAA